MGIGQDIVASLLMGLSGLSQGYGKGMESRDELMNKLSQLYYEKLLEQQDPYRQALAHQAQAMAGYYEGGGYGGRGGGYREPSTEMERLTGELTGQKARELASRIGITETPTPAYMGGRPLRDIFTQEEAVSELGKYKTGLQERRLSKLFGEKEPKEPMDVNAKMKYYLDQAEYYYGIGDSERAQEMMDMREQLMGGGGGDILVRKKVTGEIGLLPLNEFDPNLYEKVER